MDWGNLLGYVFSFLFTQHKVPMVKFSRQYFKKISRTLNNFSIKFSQFCQVKAEVFAHAQIALISMIPTIS